MTVRLEHVALSLVLCGIVTYQRSQVQLKRMYIEELTILSVLLKDY